MEEPTVVLRRFQDDCASATLPLAHQIRGMELNAPNTSYLDLRSPSRARRHSLRKCQSPNSRYKRCHPDCVAYSRHHLTSRRRRRRTRESEAECDPEAYWDKQLADLNHKELLELADPVQAYYGYGHNTAPLDSLRPRPINQRSDASVDVNEEEEVVVNSESWTLYLYSPTSSRPFPVIPNYALGESTFTWHRNLSGCWELGYADTGLFDGTKEAESDAYGCRQTPFPRSCRCCCYSMGFGECACADFPDDWPSPEESGQGWLMEWMSHEAWDAMRCADEAAKKNQTSAAAEAGKAGDEYEQIKKSVCGGEWTFIRTATPARECDLVSTLSSTESWRMLDVGTKID